VPRPDPPQAGRLNGIIGNLAARLAAAHRAGIPAVPPPIGSRPRWAARLPGPQVQLAAEHPFTNDWHLSSDWIQNAGPAKPLPVGDGSTCRGGRAALWHNPAVEFSDRDLSGVRFVRCLLRDAVIRGSDVTGMEIDDHDLHHGCLWVNGVDVSPYVETELNRRMPGRGLRTATTPAGLRSARSAVEQAWAGVLPTASGREDISVDGEWSFSQTLRHLVLATNAWLHGAILGRDKPFLWIGQPFADYELAGGGTTIFREPKTYGEVLAVRAEHQGMVRDYLATVTDEVLAETRPDPWAPEHRVQVLHCLHVILNEEWEHQRYAVRDLRKAAGG
jgi:hypothetical protein